MILTMVLAYAPLLLERKAKNLRKQDPEKASNTTFKTIFEKDDERT
jgi:hypothetical protein